MSVNFDTCKFIDEIKLRPAIWDLNSELYANKLCKANAWEEICEIFVSGYIEMEALHRHRAVLELQRRWKSFRDCYRRELKRQSTIKSGTLPNCRREYLYFKNLTFLGRTYKKQLQKPRIKTEESDSNSILSNDDEEEAADEEDIEITKFIRNIPPPPLKRKKISQPVSPHPVEQVILETPAPTKKFEENSNETDGADKYFLISLLPHFKSLPEDMKLEVYSEFLDVLKKYKKLASSQEFPYASNFFSEKHDVLSP